MSSDQQFFMSLLRTFDSQQQSQRNERSRLIQKLSSGSLDSMARKGHHRSARAGESLGSGRTGNGTVSFGASEQVPQMDEHYLVSAKTCQRGQQNQKNMTSQLQFKPDPPPPPARLTLDQALGASLSRRSSLGTSPLKTGSNFTRHMRQLPFKRKVLVTKQGGHSPAEPTASLYLDMSPSGALTSREPRTSASLHQILGQPRTARGVDPPSEKSKAKRSASRSLRAKTPTLLQTSKAAGNKNQIRCKNMPLKKPGVEEAAAAGAEPPRRLVSQSECKKLLQLIKNLQHDVKDQKKTEANTQYQELFRGNLQGRSRENQETFEKAWETYQAVDSELHRQLSKKVELLSGVRPILDGTFELLANKGSAVLMNYTLLSRLLGVPFAQCRCQASVRALTRNFDSLAGSMGIKATGLTEKQKQAFRANIPLEEKFPGLMTQDERDTVETLDLLKNLEQREPVHIMTPPQESQKSNDVSFMSESAFLGESAPVTPPPSSAQSAGPQTLRVELNKEEDNSFTLSVNGSRPLLLNLDDLGNLKLKLNHEKGSLEIEQEGLPERGLLDESVNAADPLPSEPPPANLLETTFAKQSAEPAPAPSQSFQQQQQGGSDPPSQFFFNSPPIDTEEDIPAAFRHHRSNGTLTSPGQDTQDSPSPVKPRILASPGERGFDALMQPKTPSFVRGGPDVMRFSSSQSFGALSTQRSEAPSSINFSNKNWVCRGIVQPPRSSKPAGSDLLLGSSQPASNTFANELFASLICVACKYSRYVIRDVLREVERIDSEVESSTVGLNTLITAHLQRQQQFPYASRSELQTLLKALLQTARPALQSLQEVMPQHALFVEKMLKFQVVLIERITVMAATAFSKFAQIGSKNGAEKCQENGDSPRSLKTMLDDNKKLKDHNSAMLKQLEELRNQYEKVKQYRDELSRKLDLGISQLEHNVEKQCESSEKEAQALRGVRDYKYQEMEDKVTAILGEFKLQNEKVDKLVRMLTAAH